MIIALVLTLIGVPVKKIGLVTTALFLVLLRVPAPRQPLLAFEPLNHGRNCVTHLWL
jgi:hypothetical protein